MSASYFLDDNLPRAGTNAAIRRAGRLSKGSVLFKAVRLRSRPLLDLRFRELLKTSVGKTIRDERLKAACAELTSGDATLAERCGYSDAAQLMHRFKASFGMTMREWRRNARR